MAIGFQVTFDAHDPQAPGQFRARAKGIPEERWNDSYGASDPDGLGPRLFFRRGPEGTTAKHRVHLDVNAGKGIRDSAERVKVVDGRVERCVVLLDPEDNEFCVQ